MGMRRGGYQQVHDPAPWLPPELHNSRCPLRVAVGDCVVDGQRIETTLDSAETAQSECASLLIFRDEHAELQFGQAGHADGKLTGNGSDIRGDQNAGVENAAAQRRAHGSTRLSSRRL